MKRDLYTISAPNLKKAHKKLARLKKVAATLPDELIRHHYCHSPALTKEEKVEQCYCAIGYMAHRAGLSDGTIYKGGGTGIGSLEPQITVMSNKLFGYYGLDVSDLRDIQEANDGCPDVDERKEKVGEAMARIISRAEKEIAQYESVH